MNYLENSSFSSRLPGLQLAIDSTSLGEFKFCPRRYQLSILQGHTTRLENVDLKFGILVHFAVETYARDRAQGSSHQTALSRVVHALLVMTWDKTLNRPWVSDHKTKNRFTLIRTVVWYLDTFGENDPLQTVLLSDGTPAVEQHFTFSPGFKSSIGESFILVGHLDRIATLHDIPYVVDAKTTSHLLDQDWFSQFTPDNQFSLYILGGKIVWKTQLNNLMVDGMQVLVTDSRFRRGPIDRSDYQLEQWLQDLGEYWLQQLEFLVKTRGPEKPWPQNDKNCWRCHFRPVCSRKSLSSQEDILRTEFLPKRWDPLQPRHPT